MRNNPQSTFAAHKRADLAMIGKQTADHCYHHHHNWTCNCMICDYFWAGAKSITSIRAFFQNIELSVDLFLMIFGWVSITYFLFRCQRQLLWIYGRLHKYLFCLFESSNEMLFQTELIEMIAKYFQSLFIRGTRIAFSCWHVCHSFVAKSLWGTD